MSTVTIDELRSQSGALDALYLTPSAPHQMALFTEHDPLARVPSVRPPAALDAFYAAALRLSAGHVGDWRARWSGGALAAAELTGVHLDEIGAGVPGHLDAAGLWRIGRPDGDRGYGMCGRLTTYPAEAAVRVG